VSSRKDPSIPVGLTVLQWAKLGDSAEPEAVYILLKTGDDPRATTRARFRHRGYRSERLWTHLPCQQQRDCLSGEDGRKTTDLTHNTTLSNTSRATGVVEYGSEHFMSTVDSGVFSTEGNNAWKQLVITQDPTKALAVGDALPRHVVDGRGRTSEDQPRGGRDGGAG